MSRHAERIESALAEFADHGITALLVTDPANVRYLTGYVGSNGIGVISAKGRRLITDGRYSVSARAQVEAAEVVIGERDLLDAVAVAVDELADGGPVGVEAEHVTLALADRLDARLAPVEVKPTSGIVARLRVEKDSDEIAAIEEAARIADAALQRVLAEGLVGRTERRVALAIEEALVDEGAEGASFDVIVAAGPRGARPHAVPGSEPIPDDTLVVIDLGARYSGYCSDMTRTIPVGAPDLDLARAYDVCLEAQRAAIAMTAPGVPVAQLDRAARDVIEGAGLGEAFVHGLGHGVGLDVHERPGVRRTSDETLAAGMIITIEPGIYIEGLGGVRIEDLLLVTDDGARVLSGAPIPTLPRRAVATGSGKEGE